MINKLMINKHGAYILLIFLSLSATAADERGVEKQKAADNVEITLESRVTGNREQPKVLYIVPWQEPEGPEIFDQGFQYTPDGLFEPVERDAFLRTLKIQQRMVSSNNSENRNHVE